MLFNCPDEFRLSVGGDRARTPLEINGSRLEAGGVSLVIVLYCIRSIMSPLKRVCLCIHAIGRRGKNGLGQQKQRLRFKMTRLLMCVYGSLKLYFSLCPSCSLSPPLFLCHPP